MATTRLYIDSLYRTSGTTSDFVFNLVRPFSIEPESVGFIADVSFANCFETIIPDYNNKLYIRTRTTPSGTPTDKVVYMTAGKYDITGIAAELQGKLLTVTGDNSITVTAGSATTTTTTTVPTRLHITHTNANLYMEIITKETLGMGFMTPAWSGTGADALNYANPQDANHVIGNNFLQSPVTTGLTLITSVVDMTPFKTLFLESNLNSQAYGPLGQSNYVRKLNVTGTVGDLVYDVSPNEIDYLILPRVLDRLEFRLVDPGGHKVDLQGHRLSLSLIIKEAV